MLVIGMVGIVPEDGAGKGVAAVAEERDEEDDDATPFAFPQTSHFFLLLVL